MGVDFISNKVRTFRKGWDREAAALATPDLFRPQPSGQARQIQGDLATGATVSVGEALTVRLTGTEIVAYRLDAIVVEFTAPPAEIIEALRQGCDVASAIVETFDALGGTVRISLK